MSHMNNHIQAPLKLTRRGRFVATLLAILVMLTIFGLALIGLGDSPAQAEPTTMCVSGTYLQANNTCLPINAVQGK